MTGLPMFLVGNVFCKLHKVIYDLNIESFANHNYRQLPTDSSDLSDRNIKVFEIY